MSLILATTMNEAAVDSLQNGITSVLAYHFFKGQHTVFPRIIVLLINIPLIIISLQGACVASQLTEAPDGLAPGHVRVCVRARVDVSRSKHIPHQCPAMTHRNASTQRAPSPFLDTCCLLPLLLSPTHTRAQASRCWHCS